MMSVRRLRCVTRVNRRASACEGAQYKTGQMRLRGQTAGVETRFAPRATSAPTTVSLKTHAGTPSLAIADSSQPSATVDPTRRFAKLGKTATSGDADRSQTSQHECRPLDQLSPMRLPCLQRR